MRTLWTALAEHCRCARCGPDFQAQAAGEDGLGGTVRLDPHNSSHKLTRLYSGGDASGVTDIAPACEHSREVENRITLMAIT
jgi:hypothetical protein